MQGLQRQPPDLQIQVGLVVFASVMVILLMFLMGLPCGKDLSTVCTMVQSQASNFDGAKQAHLTIARLGAAAGVGVETVRYYQRRGLLVVPASAGAIRRYDANDVRRLRFIRRAQAAGFTLDEISELLTLDRTEDRSRVRELATERLTALATRITELEQSRAALERLRLTCASGRKGPCPILEAFDGI